MQINEIMKIALMHLNTHEYKCNWYYLCENKKSVFNKNTDKKI